MGERYPVVSIQPAGWGTEVNLSHRRANCCAGELEWEIGSVGVHIELVERFLGKSFSREELVEMGTRFLPGGRMVLSWRGQSYFLATDDGLPAGPR